MCKIHGTHRVDGADDGAVLGLERQRRLLVVRRQHLQRAVRSELMPSSWPLSAGRAFRMLVRMVARLLAVDRAGFQTS